MKVVVAAGGRFHAVHLAHQLHKRGYLQRIYTGAYSCNDESYVPHCMVKLHQATKLIDVACWRLPIFRFISRPSLYVFKDNLFDRWLNKHFQYEQNPDIFVGWAHYWLQSATAIKKTGAKIILESGSCHIEEQQLLLEEEYEKFGIHAQPIRKSNKEKILKEYALADFIMTPSQHVVDSFIRRGINTQKLLKVPYGIDFNLFQIKRERPNKSFVVVFVGLIGWQKGVQYLLAAWKQLQLLEAKIVLIGAIEESFKTLLKSYLHMNSIIVMGSMKHCDVSQWYRQASVLVLPSIQEGLAMVQAEAMASGLPVICTANTGGQEFITHDRQGFVVPIRDSYALAEKILWCYEHQDFAFEMGLSAQEKVKQRTWNHYGEDITKVYKEVLGIS